MMKVQFSPELAQKNQAVEDRLPVLVAGEIIVGDEEAVDALRQIGAHHGFDLVGVAVAGFSALHIDDGAEGALERAAAPGVETGDGAAGAANDLGGQDGQRRIFHARQVGEIIIKRLELAGHCVAQIGVEPAFRLSGEQADAERLGLAQVSGKFGQHGEAARDMEAANGDRRIFRAKAPRQIQGARKLIGLHADHANHPGPGPRNRTR